MKRQSSRLLASLLAVTFLLCGIQFPAIAAEQVNWKMFQIIDCNTNTTYGLTNLDSTDKGIKGTMEPHRPLQWVENEEGMLFKIQFSVQHTQDYNLALYRLKDGFSLSTTQQDTAMLSNYYESITETAEKWPHLKDPAVDPRGDFLGYLQLCDGNGNETQIAEMIELTGYEETDIPYDPPRQSFFALPTYSNGTNIVYWNGKVKNAQGNIGSPAVNAENDNLIVVVEPRGKVLEVPDEYLDRDEDGNLIHRQERVAWANVYMTWAGLVLRPKDQSKQPDEDIKKQEQKNCDTGGDPIDMVTGSFYWDYTDLAISGQDSISFSRRYNSQGGDSGVLGKGWRHSFSYDIEDTTYDVTVTFPDGKRRSFELQKDDTYKSALGSLYTLEKTSDGGYVLSDKEGMVYQFNSSGQIMSITRYGKTLYTMTYADGKLSRVTAGNSYIDFGYIGDQLTNITDSQGRSVSYTYNDNMLATATNPDGDSLGFAYDSNGYLSEITDFKGNEYLKNEYNQYGAVTKQEIVGQGTFLLSYDPGNRVNSLTYPNGRVEKYYYNEMLKVTKVETVGEEDATQDIYENGRLVKHIDELGYETNYQYNNLGLLIRTIYPDQTSTQTTYYDNNKPHVVTNPDGSVTEYEYNDQGYATKITQKDSASATEGRVTTNTYNSSGNLLTTTDPLGNTTTYTYDSLGNVLTVTDAKNRTTTYEYDQFGRKTKQTTPDGIETTYTYTTAGKLATVTNAAGDTQTYIVDGNGYTTSVTDFAGNATLTEYNIQNKPVKITDPEGNVTQYTYNSDGLKGSDIVVMSQNAADNLTTTYVYDQKGRLISTTDPRGNTISYTYDQKGQLTATTDALSHTATSTYDTMGRVDTATDANGGTVKYLYDSMGRVLSEVAKNVTYTDPATGSTVTQDITTMSYTYDKRGNKLTQTDAEGNVTSYEYDALGRMTKQTAPGNKVTTYEYDEVGQLLKTTDPMGNITTSTYNNGGKTLTSTDVAGNMTSYEYDGMGRVSKQINSDDTFITYEYDKNGRVTKTTNELGNSYLYTYDKNGQLLTTTDPLGGVTTNEYDAAKRLVKTTDAMGNDVSYGYDKNGNKISETNAAGATVYYTYDALNRMATKTDAMGNTYTYAYDAVGNLTSTIDPENHTQTTVYDKLNRVTSQTDGRGAVTSFVYDKNGRVRKQTNALGYSVSYTYDASGNVVATTDAKGNVSYKEYDALNRCIKTTDALGNVTTYSYDALGNQTTSTDALSHSSQTEYNSRGKVTEQTDALGNVTSFSYDAAGRVVRKTNADNTYIEYEYDANDRIVKETKENGGVYTYTYDANGNVLTTTDPMGGVITYTYNALGQVLTATDAEGGVTTNEYNANGQISKKTDAEGNVTTYTYDGLGRTKTEKDGNGGTTTYVYDAAGNITKITNPDGGITTNEYDLAGRLTKTTDGEGNVQQYSYDANGNMTGRIDGRGNSYTMAFDALNRQTSVTNPKGGTSSIEYDALGRQVKTVDESGAQTMYEYDALGNLLKITDSTGHFKTFTYDIMGRVLTEKDEAGNTTSYEYDNAGNITKQTNREGEVTTYTYDLLGRKLTETDPLLHTTTYEYDALGRVVKQTDPLHHISTFTYDDNSNIKTVTDETGYITEYFYDANGNVVQTKDGRGNSVYFEYDACNRMTKTTADTSVTLYEYDKNGLVTKEINALGGNKIYTYDGNGNLLTETDEDGYMTGYTYDAVDLVSRINYADGKVVNYAYNAAGYLVEMTDWNGTTAFEVDSLGRKTKVTDHNQQVTQYTWTPTSQKASIIYPDNSTVSYEHDKENRLTKVTDGSDVTTYQYDDAGNLKQQVYPTDEKVEHSYNNKNELVQTKEIFADGTTRRVYEYNYTDAGDVRSEYSSGVGIDRQSQENRYYQYNANHEMTQARDTANGTTNYQYDSRGNLISETGVNYTYNNRNQLVTKTEGSDHYTYEYDGRGNLIKETKNGTVIGQYTYDATGRIKSGTNADGETSTYTYNGLGMRVKLEQQINNTELTHQNGQNSGGSDRIGSLDEWADDGRAGAGQKTWNDTLGSVHQDENPLITKNFVIDYTSGRNADIMVMTEGAYMQRDVYGLQRISSDLSADEGAIENIDSDIAANDITKLFYHQNRIGSTAYTTLRDATVISYTTYNEWGEVQTDERLGTNYAGIDNIHDFTGHGYDKVLDKHFAQYRMYDAKLKRFMSEDPAKDGTNWYGYARNNPATYVDLLGLLTLSNNSYTHSSCKKATELIQRRLEHNGWWNRYKEEIDRNVTFPSHVGYGYFGEATVAVVNHFKKGVGLLSEWLGQAGVVDLTAWRYMNLPDAYFAADNSSVWNGRSAKSVYYEFYPDAKPSGSSSSTSGGQPLTPKPGLERLQDILPYPINYHTWKDGTKVTIWADWSFTTKIGEFWADGENIQILNGETYGKREYINAIVADYQRSQQPPVQQYTRQQLEADLDRLSSNELGMKGIAALRTTSEALSILFSFDSKISSVAYDEGMNKAIIQSTLFRELRWYGIDDPIADEIVVQTYFYRQSCEDYSNLSIAEQILMPAPVPPGVTRNDSSTGLGQIFAKTAIQATNWRYGTQYDYNDWHTLRDFWYRLRDDDMYNLEMVGMVLAWGASLKGVSVSATDEVSIKAIFERYNGSGDKAIIHSESVYEYYLLFLKYNASN